MADSRMMTELIMSIRQTGTVSDYCNTFHKWFKQVQISKGFGEFYGIYLFILGLEPKIGDIFENWHQYSCFRVEDVISLALKIDSNDLQDSFSPFDPTSSFYKKYLEFDPTISLDELMKDNEFFRNGIIQETIIDAKDLEKSDQGADVNDFEVNSSMIISAHKVFDEMPDRYLVGFEVGFSDISLCRAILRNNSVGFVDKSERIRDETADFVSVSDKVALNNEDDNVDVDSVSSKLVFRHLHFKNKIEDLRQDVCVKVGCCKVREFQVFSDIVCFEDFWGQNSHKKGVLGITSIVMDIESFGWKPGWSNLVRVCSYENNGADHVYICMGSIDIQEAMILDKSWGCLFRVFGLTQKPGMNRMHKHSYGLVVSENSYKFGIENEWSGRLPVCFVAADNKSGITTLGRNDYLKLDVIQMGFNGSEDVCETSENLYTPKDELDRLRSNFSNEIEQADSGVVLEGFHDGVNRNRDEFVVSATRVAIGGVGSQVVDMCRKSIYHEIMKNESVLVVPPEGKCTYRKEFFTLGAARTKEVLVNFEALNNGCLLGSLDNVAVLDHHVKINKIEEEQMVFSDASDPNVIPYTALVCRYGKKEVFDDAIKTCRGMPGNIVMTSSMEDSFLIFNKFKDLPFDPGIEFWKALQGGCHNTWRDWVTTRLKVAYFGLNRATTLPTKKYTRQEPGLLLENLKELVAYTYEKTPEFGIIQAVRLANVNNLKGGYDGELKDSQGRWSKAAFDNASQRRFDQLIIDSANVFDRSEKEVIEFLLKECMMNNPRWHAAFCTRKDEPEGRLDAFSLHSPGLPNKKGIRIQKR